MKTTYSPTSSLIPGKLARPAALPAAPTFLLALLLGLAPTAEASAAQGTKNVDVVRSTFQRLDADGDGKVTSKEAARGKISSKVFAAHDDDGSSALSADEFVLLYKDLLVQAKRPVPKDLSDEVIRIQARRRVIAAKERSKSQGAKSQPSGTGSTAKAADATPAGKQPATVKGTASPGGRPSLVPTSLVPKKAPTKVPTKAPVNADAAPTGTKPATGKVPADAGGTVQPAPPAAGSAGSTGATPEETAKRVEEARRKQADLDETRIREARIKAAESAEARTRAAREKAAQEQAEARIRAAREQQARDSAKARTIAARKKAAEEAAQKKADAGTVKAERVPQGKVRSTTRKVKGVTAIRGSKAQSATQPETQPGTQPANQPAGEPTKQGAPVKKPAVQTKPAPKPGPDQAPAKTPSKTTKKASTTSSDGSDSATADSAAKDTKGGAELR